MLFSSDGTASVAVTRLITNKKNKYSVTTPPPPKCKTPGKREGIEKGGGRGREGGRARGSKGRRQRGGEREGERERGSA